MKIKILIAVLVCVIVIMVKIQEFGNGLMLQAIRENDMEKLEFYLDLHINPNTSFPFLTVFNPVVDQTPLQLAAEKGNVDAVNILLQHDADVNYAKGTAPISALAYALSSEHFEIVKILVEHGADVNYETSELVPDRSVHDATIHTCSAEIMEFMLENGMKLKDNFWYKVCSCPKNDMLELIEFFVNSPNYIVDCTEGLFFYCDYCVSLNFNTADETLIFFIENGADIYAVPKGEQYSLVDKLKSYNQMEFAEHIVDLYDKYQKTIVS